MNSSPFFSIVRVLLYPFALIYGFFVWLRNRLYDSGFYSSVAFGLPVINVGNLSVGGTGKTPHIEYLVRLLQYDYNVATMSRGYKRRTQGFILAGNDTNALRIGDEPMQYHLKFPELAVSVAEDRVTGIPTLLQRQPNIDVILLDDAFQHRSVKAGLNILITDYAQPFYKDFILPYGRLRESRTAYKRANIIIVSKCPANLSKEDAAAIQEHIAPLPQQQVFFTTMRYGTSYDFFTGAHLSYTEKNVLLVCGIARPAPLITEAERTAARVHPLAYADHHYFLSNDLEEIKAAYDNWNVPNKVILTTEKDAARLHLQDDVLRSWNIPIIVLPVEVAFLFGSAPFDATVTHFTRTELADYHGYDPYPEETIQDEEPTEGEEPSSDNEPTEGEELS